MTEPISLDAGRGMGVDFYGSNYPFVHPDAEIRGLLADFWLSYSDPVVVPPLYIVQMSHLGRPLLLEPPGAADEHQCDLVIQDSNGYVVCDTSSADSYTGRAFGNRFYIHEWIFTDKVCRVVQHTKLDHGLTEVMRVSEESVLLETEAGEIRILEQLGAGIPIHILTSAGRLDERTHEQTTDRVESIQVGTDLLTGNIVIKAGYNIQIDQGSSAAIRTVPNIAQSFSSTNATGLAGTISNLVISASPGAGNGVFPSCQDPVPALHSINGVFADSAGNILLTAADCLFVRPPYIRKDPTSIATATLRIGNNCTVCSRCSEYLDVYEEERKLNERLRHILKLTDDAVEAHVNVTNDWTHLPNLANPLYMTVYEAVEVGGTESIRIVADYSHPQELFRNGQNHVRHIFTFSTENGSVPTFLPEFTGGVCGQEENSPPNPRQIGPLVMSGAWPVFWIDWETLGEGVQTYVFFSFLKSDLRLGGVPEKLTVDYTVETVDVFDVNRPFPEPPRNQLRLTATISPSGKKSGPYVIAKPVPISGWF